jgi:hypothetical protein
LQKLLLAEVVLTGEKRSEHRRKENQRKEKTPAWKAQAFMSALFFLFLSRENVRSS